MSTSPSRIRPVATGIDFGVRSDSLVLADITQSIGVRPTSGFEKGEPYIGRQKVGSELVAINRVRPFGVWHFCTSEILITDDVEDHAKFLIQKLAPAKAAIMQFKADPTFYVRVSIWVCGESFVLPADCLAEIALLAENVSFTCWESQEENASE